MEGEKSTRLFYIYTPEYVKVCAKLPSNTLHNDEYDEKRNRSFLIHSLIQSYGIFKKITTVRPEPATMQQISKFHTQSYLDILERLEENDGELSESDESDSDTSTDSEEEKVDKLTQHGLDDCPYFPGVCEYIQNVAGGSISAARIIMAHKDRKPIAFNWEGGRHHARSDRASGFCYVNDVVLCAMELLRKFKRVLVVDIDVHHGDGVEEAFYFSNRVMTVSFHQYGPGLYPGTGDSKSIGKGRGNGYNVNVPLKEGIRDDRYIKLFEEIVVNLCIPKFKPEAIALVCGADSLHGDPLGHFNLTTKGYERCASMIRDLQLPTVVLGAGGYNAANTARCFTIVTAALISDVPLSNDIPEHDFYEFYSDTFQLATIESKMEDKNTEEQLAAITEGIRKSLEELVKVE